VKYEYQVFQVRVLITRADLDGSAWPNERHMNLLLEKMNEVGLDGWAVFERSYPRREAVLGESYPYNLWARRAIPCT
jgi:hypothetical protein